MYFHIVLQSHASLLGTGRPTHYRVLVDDNKFKADDFQSLTNKLCYLNARFVYLILNFHSICFNYFRSMCFNY